MISTLLICGCGPKPPTAGSAGAPTAATDDKDSTLKAVDLLRRSAKVYSEAKSYSDEGELSVQFPGVAEPSRFSFATAFQRAGGKVRIAAYQLTLATDGKRMRGFIEDGLSNNLDGQFLDASAPKQLTPQTLIEDAEAASILSQGAGGPPPVIEWLLTKEPFAEVLAEPSRLKRLPSEQIDGRLHYRVEVNLGGEPPASASKIILWIDPATSLIARLEYPGVPNSPVEGAAAEKIAITADFRKAQVNGAVEEGQFVLKPTADAKVVSFFVAPPPPIPRDRLGKPTPKFELDELAGGKLSSEELLGKTAVLLFVRDHPACEQAAKELAAIYPSLANDPRFVFRVVVNESQEVSNANIAGMLERWKVTIPASRDEGAASRDALGITGLPTLVILDAKGRLQLSQSFGFAGISATLPAVCEQIAAGEEIFTRLLEMHKQYEERLEIAKSGGKAPSIALTPTAISPAKPPKRLKLETMWDAPEFKSAACLVAASIEGKQKLLVLESPRTVHWLGLDGKPLDKKELMTPTGTPLSVVRLEFDAAGRPTFAAFTPGGEAAYFFDAELTPIGSFPPANQPHEGVADALLSDLDGKDGLEAYVGFNAFLGVQATTVDGKRLWRNLAIPSVISLAQGPPNVAGWRKLYATDDRGRIIMLNQFGKHEFIELADREVHRLFHRAGATIDANEPPSDGDAIYCGISFQEKEKLLAIGYDAEFNEAWTYNLPPGVFVGPVQYVASVRMPKTKDVLWLMAAPDGSIHFVGSRGQFEDSFQTGERVLGLSATATEEAAIFFYATESGVHARSIELPSLENDSK